MAVFPSSRLKHCEREILKLLDMFTPRLIAGISDQLSPNGDIENLSKNVRV